MAEVPTELGAQAGASGLTDDVVELCLPLLPKRKGNSATLGVEVPAPIGMVPSI